MTLRDRAREWLGLDDDADAAIQLILATRRENLAIMEQLGRIESALAQFQTKQVQRPTPVERVALYDYEAISRQELEQFKEPQTR